MPRPKKYESGTTNLSFSIPYELKDNLLKKIDTMALAENLSRSEWIWRALMEIIKIKEPGNPQPPLGSFLGTVPQPVRLKAKWTGRDISSLLDEYESKKNLNTSYVSDLRKAIESKLMTLMELNLRIQDSGIQPVIERALKALDEKAEAQKQ